MNPPVIGITGRADRSARPSNAPLFAITPTYVRAVELGGGAPLIIPPHLDEARLRTAFEHLDGLILFVGVQWHPEAMLESQPVMRRLFEGVVEAARARSG